MSDGGVTWTLDAAVLPCVLRLVAGSVVLGGAVQQLDVCGAKRGLNNHR